MRESAPRVDLDDASYARCTRLFAICFCRWTTKRTLSLEPEHPIPRLAERRVQRGGERDAQRITGVDRIENAVVPQLGGRIIGAHLRLVGAQGVAAHFLEHFGVRLHAVALELAQLDLDQGVGRL